MKKSVYLVIMAIFVASVVLVGYFGVKMASYNPTTYIESIECVNNEIKRDKTTQQKYILIRNFSGTRQVQLDVKVLPEDATNKNLNFLIMPDDEAQSEMFSVTDRGLVTIKAPGNFTVYIKTTDGSYKTEEVRFLIFDF